MKPHVRNLVTLSGVLMAAMVMVGCASGAHMPAMGVSQNASNFAQSHVGVQTDGSTAPMDKGGCQHSDGVRVTPCRVVFNASNPGPTNVKARSDGHRITEKDNCATSGVAMVALVGNRVYSVTAGTVAGSCTARFKRTNNNNDDDGGQGAVLTVVNRL